MIRAFVNPDAGTASRTWEALRVDPRFAGHWTPADELPEALDREREEGRRRVLVAGGDGTVATAAHVLAGTGVALAILPAGTLNHFARDLGIPTNPRSALDLAASASTRAVDVGYVNERIFLNTSSLGLYGELARSRDRLRPWLGHHVAVLFAGAAVLARIRPFPVTVTFGSESRSYRSPLVFVGVRERDLTLSGFGRRLEDGASALHVIVVSGRARRRLLALAVATAARGIWRGARSAGADSVLVDACRIEVGGEAVPLALDGDVERADSPLDYRIGRDALTVVAPPPDRSPLASSS